MTIQHRHKISSPVEESDIYEKESHITKTAPLPPKPTLDILPTKIDLHVLLALGVRVNRARQPLRPLQRALVALLRLLAYDSDQVARHIGALALDVAKVLLDAAAQRVDALAHFLGVVVVGKEVAAGFAGGGGARGDGGGVAGVGGELGLERVEEVLVMLLAVLFLFT